MAIEATTGAMTGAAQRGAADAASTSVSGTASGAVSGSAPGTAVSAATLLSALASGATLEARLIALLADGSARLATRLGPVTAKATDGSILPPVGTQMTLRVDAGAATDGEPMLLARPTPGGGAATARADGLSRPPAEIVGQAVATALARQQGLGAGFEAIAALVGGATPLSPEVTVAADRLLRTRLPLDRPPTAKALAGAMRNSGIFLEAELARAEAPGAGDVKAALLALKAALAPLAGIIHDAGRATSATVAAAPSASGAPVAAPGAVSVPPGQGAPSASPSPSAPAAVTPAAAPPTTDTVDPSSPTRGPAPPTTMPPIVAGPTARAAMAATSAPLPATAAAPNVQGVDLARAGLLSLQEIGATAAVPVRPPSALAGAQAAPPLRGSWPEPETRAPETRAPDSPAAATGTAAALADPSTADPVERARAGMDAALARVVLDQVASLTDDGSERARAASQGERVGPQWNFEVPMLLDGRSGSLRFQVERDGGERREGGTDRKTMSWRLRLAFAIEPLGPIRAQVGLVGGRVAVGIWAERPATVAVLTAHSGTLRDALVAADFDVDEIHLAEGVPPDAARRGGRAMVERLA